METIRELQAYGYIFFTIFLAVILYAYLYHLYRSEKSGERNFEKYADMALHDDVTDAPIEPMSPLNKAKD